MIESIRGTTKTSPEKHEMKNCKISPSSSGTGTTRKRPFGKTELRLLTRARNTVS